MSKHKISDFLENYGDGIHGTPNYDENGTVYFINGNNLVNGKIQINANTLKITEEEANKIKRDLNEKTLLLSINGTLGNIALYNHEKITLGKSACFLNVKEEKDKIFLKYVLSTKEFKKYMQLVATGSTIKNLAPSQVANYEFELKDNVDKYKVSNLLSSIDNKIENNNKINAELESLAKTIYDYWFLQFEFPNEDGKPYKSSGGKMVWNEELKREIPEGWNYVLLQEFEKNIITGKTPSTKNKDNFGGNIPFITIGDIRNNTFITKTEITLSEQGSKSQENKYIPEGSICVTCIATTGLVGITTKKSQTNQQINSIICQNSFNRFYLLYAIRDFFKFSSGAKSGNTFANMSKRDFENIQLIQPEESILKQFEKKIAPILMSVKNNSVESEKLSSLRDFLLPMLMNGQITFG